MKKTEEGRFLLNYAELKALVEASIETAQKVMKDPMYDPNDNGLPYFVNRGYQLLTAKDLFTPEQLDGTLEDSTDSLETCPFCGSQQIEITEWDENVHAFWVSCDTCGATGPNGITEAEAIERWNKRVEKMKCQN